jgi:hypothetical protein
MRVVTGNLSPFRVKAVPPMAAKTIADLDIQGRRVFIRVDFDVPLTPAGGVSDAMRAFAKAYPPSSTPSAAVRGWFWARILVGRAGSRTLPFP